ncbi:MAG: AmmeMemoRadiSam system protein B [Deltaproteobacteria bacterium RBG_13_61_14]|nr:MAG: AmmeMemoRadiSam system protein B [Deltaproteobacteria bacterium RBG_13_61_14]
MAAAITESRSPAQMVASFMEPAADREKALGIIAPHAGYIYSGKGAGIVYSRVEVPATVVVLCPNHRGLGEDVAIMSEGSWQMPTGEVALDAKLASRIKKLCHLVKEDHWAHSQEHSLEVQLPFLQQVRPGFKLVPISLSRVSLSECRELGEAMAAAITESRSPALVVASSDMTHFQSAETAKQKDELALQCVRELNPEALFETVLKHKISMCGFIPATVMLYAAKKLGATSAQVVDYRNSGDVTGDYGDVVAYAAVIVK